MSSYIITRSGPIDVNELTHHGVKGMKWGVRRARGHGGTGIYLTKKRRLAGDKRDLEALKNGKHLSVGITKKRQAAFDKRDKAALEKRISKQQYKEAKEAVKEAKFQKTVAKYKKHGLDYNLDTAANVYTYGWKGAKRIEDRIKNKKMSRLKAETIETGRTMATTALMTVGTFAAIGIAATAAEKLR